jgi:hypothetical protein
VDKETMVKIYNAIWPSKFFSVIFCNMDGIEGFYILNEIGWHQKSNTACSHS